MTIMILLMLSGFAVNITKENIKRNYSDEEIVKAIFISEGGAKARYKFGIRSVSYENYQDARAICKRTVHNARSRWIKAGKRGDFLEALARQYCPMAATNDPRGLNKNWKRNVQFYLKRGV